MSVLGPSIGPGGDQASRRPLVVLGVGGGIAAYKVVEVLRRLSESGVGVQVVPTAAALNFVGAATWEALSGRPVATDVWTDAASVPHVRLAREADLVLVAPATADLLSRAATGRCDDLLTSTLLTARCPVLYVPAMHTEMWEHPATVDNVALLRRRGALVLDPASGRLTGADSGPGRLPEAAQIAELAGVLLTRPLTRDLAGRRVVVTAGGTREPLDPVRYLGNRSSGRQGHALAAAAAARGAAVTLITSAALPVPAGVVGVPVATARQLQAATAEAARDADLVVMTAAVADYRPADPAAHKLKRSGPPPAVQLVENPDVLAGLVAARRGGQAPTGQVLVGFAAETGDPGASVLEHGRAKLAAKGCDLLVVNDVSDGRAFGTEDNAAVVLAADGESVTVQRTSKALLAHRVLDVAAERLGAAAGAR